MTRVHVRLLGPCFKTGPKSTQSSSVADRYRSRTGARAPIGTLAGLSKVNRTTNSGPGTVTALGPLPPCTVARACDGLDALVSFVKRAA